MSLDNYLISDSGFLHKIVREEDKPFHALVVHITCNKYVLHQLHDALGHNGILGPINVLNGYIIGKDWLKMLMFM